ncbi:MAG: 3-phosphoshikimate 1-carboxyvinyltransferase [Armatimonadetes bacterium]|nr:3-phosphoshikimate 1-carboxyvinyltransferase [Armatimonadota bacterium]MDE2205235.1 3-phosphoshikimate 1-carboxyvinyltransferase [Armatimonadota bacterium]
MSLADTIAVLPLETPPDAVIPVPGSKSITNRGLVLAALADGVTEIVNALDSDDTQVMAEALRALGIQTECDPAARTIRVTGCCGRIPAASARLFLGNSGTSIRFLAALCSLGHGEYRFDGTERMRARPQAGLLDGLRAQGVGITFDGVVGCAPFTLHANGLAGGTMELSPAESSQFLSALLMAAPYAQLPMAISILGDLRPNYVAMTCAMMARFGVECGESDGVWRSASGPYLPPGRLTVEPDASSASYFFAAAAITGGRVTVPGLNHDSLQGDVAFTEVLRSMGCRAEDTAEGLCVEGPPPGCLQGVDRDMRFISDTSLTLAAIAPFATTPTTIRGIAHSRLQESDRVSAMCTELRRLGVTVHERPDGMTIEPAAHMNGATLDTWQDHRVAMSLAITALRSPGVVLRDPACAGKTFPEFWQTLELLRLRRPSGV